MAVVSRTLKRPMPDTEGSPGQQRLIAELAAQENDEERLRLVARHPELNQRELVAALCDRAVALLRVNLDQASRLVQVAREIAEHIDDDHSRARSHRASANLSMFQKDFRSALKNYELALETFERTGDEHQSAITRTSALHSLCHLGRFDQAFEWAATARRTFLRCGDRLRLARLESNLGTILSRQDRFQEALERYRSAYEELLQVGTPRDVGASLRNIAVSLQDSNEFQAALEAYGQARTYCSRHNLPLLVLEVDYNIAYLHYLRGEYARAIRLFEQNRKSCERFGDPHHEALCDLDQSEIYLELNMPAEAAHLAERGRRGFEKLGMRYEVAKCLTNLAIARSRQGETLEAIRLFGEARAIFVHDRNEVWTAMIDFYRSRLVHQTGELEKAYRLVEAASLAFTRASLPSRVALCDIHKACLSLESGQPEQARRCCAAALERVRSLGLPALEHQAWVVSGRTEEELGHPSRALVAYREAEATLERLRSHLQTDELKTSFLADKQEVYQSLVWLTLENDAEADWRSVFTNVEKAKSRSLADLLAFRATEMPARSGEDSEVVERLRRLRQELNPYYRQIDRKLAENNERSRRQLEKLRRLCRKKEDEVLRALREVRSVDAELSSLQQGTVIALETIQSQIPENAILIEYYFARGTVYACVVGRRTIEIIAVSSAERVRELHRYLQHQLSKLLIGRDYAERFGETLLRSTETYLRELYQELLLPLASSLDGCHHLIVVPHDVLHFVPFHALHDGDHHLIDRFSISYAPSASVFYLCRAKEAPTTQRSLVLGVDDERAPRIRQEAQTVAGILPGVLLLLGRDATEENLRRYGAQSRIIHLATHGYFRRDSPMFSAIQLASSRLSLFDFYDLELAAELVVLSGCGTGLSEVTAAEELVGLVRGLLYAGARSVLVTLWDVNDDSTTRFMASFYQHQQAGLRPAEALRTAMRELRETHPHPYHWAPFVLVGEPGETHSA